MIQRGCIAGLAQELVAGGPVVDRRPEHFESDLPMERGVVCQEHDTDPAAAEYPLNSIGAYRESRNRSQADSRLQSDVRLI
jgi:hypothetical protein